VIHGLRIGDGDDDGHANLIETRETRDAAIVAF
jgi:hypothetical protein